MQRRLLSLECGSDEHGLEYHLHDRWLNLHPDPTRFQNLPIQTAPTFLSLPSAPLLLVGGTPHDTPGLLALLHVPPPRQKPPPDPLVFATSPNLLPNAPLCATFFPEDVGLFVTGDSAGVAVWDTGSFTVAQRVAIGEVNNVHMSPVGKNELVAVGCADLNDIVLFDLVSGAATHRLQTEGGVKDVRWSPTHPFLVAGCGNSGVRLFDVRRGRACLAELSETRKMPTFQGVQQGEAKRRKVENGDVLGMRMLWEEGWKRRRRKGIGEGVAGLGGGSSQLRFTWDGAFLITGGMNGRMRVWDVVTGKFVRVIVGGKGEVYEICRDDTHFVQAGDGRVEVRELESGRMVGKALSGRGRIVGMEVHSSLEEVYAIDGNGTIQCWDGEEERAESGSKGD